MSTNSLSQSQQKFSGELFKTVSSLDSNANLMISPLSVFVAIMMALLGAKGDTRHEIQSTLHLNRTTQTNKSFKNLYDSLRPSMDDGTLTLANNIFVDSHVHLQDTYQNKLKEYYDTESVLCNFQKDPEQGRRTINKWVGAKTNGLIKSLMPKGSIDPYTKVVLANAIHFKGSWSDTFDRNHTTKDTFFHIDGSSSENAIMMNKHEHNTQYGQNENAKWVKLPYNGDFSATFIMPHDPHDITEDTMNQLQSYVTDHHDILNKLTTNSVKLTRLAIPKFKVKCSTELSKALKKMGMKKAFSNAAEFNKMTENLALKIDSVVHESFMKVDEHGTEAAAATGVRFVPRSLVLNPVNYDFVANRPFMMIIEHVPSSTILFMGKIMNVV